MLAACSRFLSALVLVGAGLLASHSAASTLDSLPLGDLNRGIKTALEQGARTAVNTLGRPDGFWGHPRLRIPLPEAVRQSRSTLLAMGRGKQLDELERGVNRVAEQALPLAQPILLDAIRDLIVYDGKGIVRGSPDAATQYFRSRTQADLARRLQPVVKQLADRYGLARIYNGLAEKARPLSLSNNEHATVEQYVTARALDGLYATMAEQERKLRANPAAASSEAVRKVFGSRR
ncbi:MAG: DUF4197 domain-containing protein [Burkholderiaceae bacterium]